MNANNNVALAAATHTAYVVQEIISTYRGMLQQYDMLKPFPPEARENLERCQFWYAVAALQAR